MKKITENRYPHSATLFRFCKEALGIRYEGNVKVIDQDVGAILGYDPADCSHWKKGKKNIRALSTLRSIADHLSIDERLLIDIAAGKIGFDEAVFEYQGYGNFALKGSQLEGLRKNYFKNPGKWQKDGTAGRFDDVFDIDRDLIAEAADRVLNMGKVTESPVYIPELLKLFPQIHLKRDEASELPIRIERVEQAGSVEMHISHKGDATRPYIRFLLAKHLFHFMRAQDAKMQEDFQGPDDLIDIQANIFAGMLLVPGNLLQDEVENLDSSRDIITQLAETFWVSKAFMNQRLSDFMLHRN